MIFKNYKAAIKSCANIGQGAVTFYGVLHIWLNELKIRQRLITSALNLVSLFGILDQFELKELQCGNKSIEIQ
jgi:hypothetical protein